MFIREYLLPIPWVQIPKGNMRELYLVLEGLKLVLELFREKWRSCYWEIKRPVLYSLRVIPELLLRECEKRDF